MKLSTNLRYSTHRDLTKEYQPPGKVDVEAIVRSIVFLNTGIASALTADVIESDVNCCVRLNVDTLPNVRCNMSKAEMPNYEQVEVKLKFSYVGVGGGRWICHVGYSARLHKIVFYDLQWDHSDYRYARKAKERKRNEQIKLQEKVCNPILGDNTFSGAVSSASNQLGQSKETGSANGAGKFQLSFNGESAGDKT